METTQQIEREPDTAKSPFAGPLEAKKSSLALFCVTYAAAALSVPLAYFDLRMGLACAVICLLLSLSLTKSSVSGAILAVLFAIALTVAPNAIVSLGIRASYLVAFGVLSLSICLGSMSGAFLHTLTNPGIAPAISLVAAIGIYAVTKKWELGLAAFAALPSALLLGFATKRCERRTTVICYAAGGILISLAVFLAIYLQQTRGEINVYALHPMLKDFQEGAIRNQIAQYDQVILKMYETIEQNASVWTAQQTEAAEAFVHQTMLQMSSSAIRSNVSGYFALIPGAVAVLALISGYLAQKMLLAGYETAGLTEAVTPEAEFFTVSIPSAAIFVASAFFAVALTDGFLASVAVNLCLALTPGFLIYGIGCLRAKLKLLPKGMLRRLWLPIAVLLISIASSLLLLLSLFGAYDKLFGAIRKKLKQNKNNP